MLNSKYTHGEKGFRKKEFPEDWWQWLLLTEATLFLSQPSINGTGTACPDVLDTFAQGDCSGVTVGAFLPCGLGMVPSCQAPT